MLRALLALPLVAAATLALGVLAILAGLLDRSGGGPHAVARLWARLVLAAFGVRVAVTGSDNVVDGPALYAANHASALDIPILFAGLPVGFRIIHKSSLYLIPVLGWALFVAGHVGIDRGNAFRARRSLDAAAERIRRGTSVAVFPEGTRSRDGRLGLFKRGSFVLALTAGVPVVPVSLAGVKRLAPSGVLSLRPGTVRLRIHPALPTLGREPEQGEALAEEVRGIVAGALTEEPA